MADEIELKVKNLEAFIENLNNASYLLQKGHRTYQLRVIHVRRLVSLANGSSA